MGDFYDCIILCMTINYYQYHQQMKLWITCVLYGMWFYCVQFELHIQVLLLDCIHIRSCLFFPINAINLKLKIDT